jgi:hypothetical protein
MAKPTSSAVPKSSFSGARILQSSSVWPGGRGKGAAGLGKGGKGFGLKRHRYSVFCAGMEDYC